MNEKEIKLKVLEEMKKAMMEDMGKKGADVHKPKGALIIEKEAIAIPKDKLAEELKGDEEGLPEESLEDKLAEGEEESPALEDSEEDMEGGDLLQKIMELRKAKKEKMADIG